MKNGTQMKAVMIPTGRIIGDKMVRAIMSAPSSSSSVPTRTEAGSRYL
jgi:hypothetical protein